MRLGGNINNWNKPKHLCFSSVHFSLGLKKNIFQPATKLITVYYRGRRMLEVAQIAQFWRHRRTRTLLHSGSWNNLLGSSWKLGKQQRQNEEDTSRTRMTEPLENTSTCQVIVYLTFPLLFQTSLGTVSNSSFDLDYFLFHILSIKWISIRPLDNFSGI